MRRKLGAGDDADRRFVRVLAAVLDDGLDLVEAAVREALLAGITSDDVILNILARRCEPPRPLAIVTPDAWRCAIRLVPTAAATTACEVSIQRHEMMAAMAELGLKGMAGAFDEAVTTGLQRKRTMIEILTDLGTDLPTHPSISGNYSKG